MSSETGPGDGLPAAQPSSPSSPPLPRVGDAERHRAVDRLSAAFAEGRLTPEEFDERSTAALAARTQGDLDQLTADLPAVSSSPVAAPGGPLPAGRRGDGRLIAVFGGVERKSRWWPGLSMSCVAIFGGAELDFRQAVVSSRSLTMRVLAVFGGVEITVPDDWSVSMSGISLFGGREIKGDPSTAEPTVHLHLQATAVFGGITVRHRRR